MRQLQAKEETEEKKKQHSSKQSIEFCYIFFSLTHAASLLCWEWDLERETKEFRRG